MADVAQVGQGISTGAAAVGGIASIFNPAIGLGIMGAGAAIGAGLQLFADEPEAVGPTAGQQLAAYSARRAAERLGAGAGLSESQVSRIKEGAREQANVLAASVLEMARTTPISTPMLNRMVKEATRRSQQLLEEADKSVLVADIEKAQADLRASMQAEQIAGQREDAIRRAEYEADVMRKQVEAQRQQQFSQVIAGVTRGAVAIAGLPTTPEAQQPFTAEEVQALTPVAERTLATDIPAPVEALEATAQPKLTDTTLAAESFATRQGYIFDNTTGEYINPATGMAVDISTGLPKVDFTSEFLGI